jgi:hypothetical protein
MKVKIAIGILIMASLFVGGILFLSDPVTSGSVLTKEEAIEAAIAVHPELASYQTTSLPPSNIEVEAAPDGWYLGFIQRGSGVPGVLSALCYKVNHAKEVTPTGQYSREKGAAVEDIVLSTCQPKETSPSPAVLPYGNVVLKLGERATFKDISIRPLSIEEDSRCPADVQCIWAGRVRVKLQVISGMGTATSIVTLGQAFTTEAEVITLIDVTPAKHGSTEISPAAYGFTFNVVPQNAPVVQNPKGKCYVGGCSAQLCTDRPDAVSTCEYNAKYACYKQATCERQSSGWCGWTETPQLAACLLNS